MQDASDPCHRPAEDSARQPAGGEAVSASAGSTAEYSVSGVLGRDSHCWLLQQCRGWRWSPGATDGN